MKTELCEIMSRYGSDKGGGWHNYTEFYYDKFKALRDKELKIFELGLGTNNPDIPSSMGVDGSPGASLLGWEEFFPNSEIYGADIDKDILFSKDRIKTFYCDQTNAQVVQDMWKRPELEAIEFDIIIDDGLHDCAANMTFLENSIHKLKIDGLYIIEDIYNHSLAVYTQVLNMIKSKIKIDYSILQLNNNNINCVDNNLILINRI